MFVCFFFLNIENVDNNAGITLDPKSYFYLEKVQNI